MYWKKNQITKIKLLYAVFKQFNNYNTGSKQGDKINKPCEFEIQ